MALRADREDALAVSNYRRSTLGRSVEEVGYIHCSFAHQVRATAERFYRGRTDVVLLAVDTGRLGVPVLVESTGGSGGRFPHIYGPLPTTAVLAVRELRFGAGGRVDLGEVTTWGPERPPAQAG